MENLSPYHLNLTSVAEVTRIAGLTDPVDRNYHITQSYHEISLVLSKHLGKCANWCTFATWASRQAGQTIRGEDLAQALKQQLAVAPAITESISDITRVALLKGTRLGHQRIVRLIWETFDPKPAMARASAAVGRGNQKVYAEIAREFARFIECCLYDTSYQADNIASFCGALKTGGPPNGQQYLRQAFTRYYQARFEKDHKRKTELILLANMECGFHEQTRLQPEIQEAMEASVLDGKLFKNKLLKLLFPNQHWVLEAGSWFSAVFNRPTPLDKAIDAFIETLRHHIRLFLTAHLMELGFPNGLRLHLGKDLKAHFPAHLQQLDYPELIVFLKNIDPTPDSLTETGAVDWANLNDRLHFICDLFRCYHETEDLLGPPFSPQAYPGAA